MNAKEAIAILTTGHAGQVAQTLGVSEGPGWRDNTGTAHLYIRSAFMSLERINRHEASLENADIAMSTATHAEKNPGWFLGENTKKAAIIALKILEAEKSGAIEVSADIITIDELKLLATDLQSFTASVFHDLENKDPSTQAFAGALTLANGYYQDFANGLETKLIQQAESKSDIKKITSAVFVPFPFNK
jgi:hypothetical protein